MKKITLIISIGLLAGCNAFAQSRFFNATTFSSLKKVQMPVNYRTNEAQKPTGIQSRLIAAVPYLLDDTNWIRQDSVRLYWSNNQIQPNINGMNLIERFVAYVPMEDVNTSFHYIYFTPNCDSDYVFSDSYPQKDINTLDADGYVTNSLTSTLLNAAWTSTGLMEYTYDNYHNRSSATQKYAYNGQIWTEENRYLFSYNPNNKVLKQTNQDLSDVIWNNEKENSFAYDSQNKRIADSFKSWNSNNWKADSFQIYAYNTTGLLDTLKTFLWNSATSQWQEKRRQVFTYNNTDKNVAITFYGFNGSQWGNPMWFTYSYSGNNLDSILLQYWDGLSSSRDMELFKFTYDPTYHQLTRYEVLTAQQGGGFSLVFYFNFYYETYDDGLGIDKQNNQLKATIFPNPANEKITVNFTPSSQVRYVRLLDLSGRLLHSFALHGNSGKFSVSTASLAAGMYFLQSQTEDARCDTQPFVVKHL